MNINEKVLEVWLQLIMTINSEKLVTDMPFNEAMICNILFKNPEDKCTATMLCEKLQMQKSQMNRTLNSMEEKGMIERVRSDSDKRVVYIKLTDKCHKEYDKLHHNVLAIVDKIINKLDDNQIQEVIKSFTLVIDAAKDIV